MDSICTVVRRDRPKDNLEMFHPLLRKIYASRGVMSAEDVCIELKDLLPFNLMRGIKKTIMRLAQALSNDEKILIVGDFDVDGATSSAVAVSVLRAFGSSHVAYLVPNRFNFGYGLTPEIVDVAAQEKPDLIITVDNGISSHAGVERAKELGIDVLITDHHLPGKVLPNAYAIVNPNQKGCEFPSKNLAGVGVIFYVMLALRAHLKQASWFEEKNIPCPKMSQFLDLVALGTVADVVPLDKNNRILVSQGLKRIRAGCVGSGMRALLQISGRKPEKLKAIDLGFAIGPRLNAAGRLNDMTLGISCLLSNSPEEAMTMAQELDDLNKERRTIEAQMQLEAFKAIEDLNLNQELPLGLCVYQEHWHQGVVGLVAARVKEKIHRPVIAFAKVEDGVLKGSARSVVGLHIRDVLETIAVNHSGLISKFGGHAMAAGLSLSEEDYDKFSAEFSKEVAARIKKSDLKGCYETDGELAEEELTLEIAEMLNSSGPWGQGFPEPIFDGKFSLISQRVVGGRHLKLVLQLKDSDRYIDAIVFNANLEEWPDYNCRSITLVYRLDINEFGGRRRLQLVVEHMMPADDDSYCH